jgi:tetratricopeptide (TPR) repeat protein
LWATAGSVMVAEPGRSGTAGRIVYRQDITVASGFAYGVTGADLHVFADGVPLYLLANWQGADEAELSWLREIPSRMLNARFAVVDFTGRQGELARLRQWGKAGPRLAVQWLHAPGGTGKTRLAAQFAAESAAAGWKVVTAIRGPGSLLPELPSQDVRPGDAAGLLLIVDYADQWPLTHLATLLSNSLLAQSGLRTRILLLARTEDSWERVRTQLDIGPFTPSSEFLAPLPAGQAQREQMFAAARDSFGRCYGLADASGIGPPMPLDHPGLGLTLAVHVAALVAVDARDQPGGAPADPADLTAYLLNREHAHWEDLSADGTHELNPAERTFTTSSAVMSRIVFTAALTGPVPKTVGIGALRGLDDAPDPEPTLADHAFCYPPARQAGGTVLEPLYPDRLAEDYLALTIPGHEADFPDKPWAVGTGGALLVRSRSPEGDAAVWIPRAITFLAAAAERWRHVGPRYLYPLLDVDPRLALDAGGAALSSLAHLADAPISLFEAIEPHLPADSDPDLDVGIAAVARRLTEYRLARTSDTGERAWLYDRLAVRLSRAGLRAEALAAAREAVLLCRSLARADPHSFELVLAANLAKMSTYLAEMGQRKEALDAAMEATALWKRLADADPDAHGSGLANSLHDLGTALSEAGRPREALAAAEKAVAIQRRLAAKDPVTHRRWLAGSLINLSVDLGHAGQWAPAAARASEALGIFRELAAGSPAVSGPSLSRALGNLGGHLTKLGEHAQALAMIQESVDIRRRLAKANPAAFEPDLATSLGELAGCLADLGRTDEALVAAEEALEIRRGLAAALPAAFDADLAIALHNVAVYQSALGWHDAALATSEQAAQVWRRLADGDPAAFNHRLAQALSGLAANLAGRGRDAEALAAAEAGLAIQRTLAEEAPEMHLSALAASLTNLGGYLSRQGRPGQGLTAAEEAVGIYRALAEAYPAAYEPDYATALNKLGLRHSDLGQHAQAASAIQESSAVYRRLAATNPAKFEPELARVLRNLSPELDQAQQHAEAADVEQEAVTLLRRLAARDGATWAGELGGALHNLAVSRLTEGQAEEAVALAEESVAVFQALASIDPVAARADLTRAGLVLRAAQAKRAWSRRPWRRSS